MLNGPPWHPALLVAILVGASGCLVDREATEEPSSQDSDTPSGDGAGPACLGPCDHVIAAQAWREFEPSVAINPTDVQNILVAAGTDLVADSPNDVQEPVLGEEVFGGPGAYGLTTYVTFDGGATWTSAMLPYVTNAPPGTTWNLFCWFGDPVAFFGPEGTAYLTGVAGTCASGARADGTINIFFTKSRDGGRTWQEPSVVWMGQFAEQFNDKPWGAIDPATGRLAIAWTAFTGALLADQELFVSVSTDGGSTWSRPPRTATRASPADQVVDAPIWAGFAGNFLTNVAWGSDGALHVGHAADCDGAPCVQVSTTRDLGETWTRSTVGSVVLVERSPAQDIWSPYPVLAVDRSNGTFSGRIYSSFVSAAEGDYDVWWSSSDDGAATWSAPARLNADPPGNGRDQFQHSIAMDGGILHAMFFDRRNDPANLRIQATHARLDPTTGSVVEQALQEPWEPMAIDESGFKFGDYETIAASQGRVAIAWTQSGPPKPESKNDYAADLDVHLAVFDDPRPDA